MLTHQIPSEVLSPASIHTYTVYSLCRSLWQHDSLFHLVCHDAEGPKSKTKRVQGGWRPPPTGLGMGLLHLICRSLVLPPTQKSKERSSQWSCVDLPKPGKGSEQMEDSMVSEMSSRLQLLGFWHQETREKRRRKIGQGRWGLDGICSWPDFKHSAFFFFPETTYFVIIALASSPLSFNLICLTLNSWNRFSLPWIPSSWLAECSWMLPKKGIWYH